MTWNSMRDFPKKGWVFVYFTDGIEYGQAEKGKLNIGGELFDVTDGECWCDAPEPTYPILTSI